MPTPTLQSNVNVTLRYAAESTFGTQASGSGQLLRRVSSSLALAKDAFMSNEVRPDQQVSDFRHGVRRAGGTIQGELSKTTYDDLIAAALRSTWNSGATPNEVTNGVLRPSFTIEQYYPDIDVSELYTGMRVGGMQVSMPPTGMATISFDFQGQNMTVSSGASAPVYASPTAATTTGLMAGVNGTMSIDGVASVIVTGLDLSLTNNLSSTPVVGSTTVPDIFYGRSVVTGTVSAFFVDSTLITAFLNETAVKLTTVLTATDSTTLAFHLNKVKLTAATKTVGPDGGVIVSFPFQALLATSVSGDADGTLLVERT